MQYQVRFYIGLLKSLRPVKGCRIRPSQKWVGPPVGWVKINLDGAFDQAQKRGGLGLVVRDSEGNILGGTCSFLSNVTAPDLIEAYAGRFACEFVSNYNLSPVIFEADCLKLVTASGSEEDDDSDFGLILEDVKSLLGTMPSSFFSHVYREANSLAHRLAKFALLDSVHCSWYGSIPSTLSDLLISPCTYCLVLFNNIFVQVQKKSFNCYRKP